MISDLCESRHGLIFAIESTFPGAKPITKRTISNQNIIKNLYFPMARMARTPRMARWLANYPDPLVETYRNQVLQHRLTIKNPDMIYLRTNVAKTQDVPLDGTIFFGNTD